MSDIRIVSSADLSRTVSDWLLLKSGNLDESEELANYVKVALMTDRLSDEWEVRPDPDSDDRKGWWGDLDANTIWRGWKIGTKNWLLTRAKISDMYSMEGDTVVRAETYTREALQPLIDMSLCSSINVTANRVDIDRIDVSVVIFRGPEAEIELVFQDLWNRLKEVPVLSPYGATV
jgi:phage gp46-like protein